MSFRPARKSVAAVARMMKYITTFEKAMPVKTSWRASRSSWSLAPRRSATVRRPLARSSSTSCEACQKNRYGEIVRHARPERRARHRVGRDAARVVVGGAGDETRPERPEVADEGVVTMPLVGPAHRARGRRLRAW